MDENIKIEISETNRGKEQLIINRKYKYNFSRKLKNSKVYVIIIIIIIIIITIIT